VSRDTGDFLIRQEGVATMKYQQLTSRERYLIRQELSIQTSIRQIALKLSRSPSTISREVRRNARTGTAYYDPMKAHSYATARRKRCRLGPNFKPRQVQAVQDLLATKWSPEQISGRLRRLMKLAISMSTIYRWIKKNKRQGGDLWEQTRRLSKRYRKGYRVKDSRGKLAGKTPLSERPQAANDRTEFGHWEGDTVMGSDGRHCILTLVERMTRIVRIIKLPTRRVVDVNRAMSKLFNSGKFVFKSIALDNGTEFHGYAKLQKRFGIKFYFARPYHSWERGPNENTNGLIRQYLPKGSCFKELTQHRCNAIEKELNCRPRKTLDYQTPQEAYDEKRCA
jgi:IS30 family transposase